MVPNNHHVEGAYPRERTPRARKPPPAAPEPASQAVNRGYKDPPSIIAKVGHKIVVNKGPKDPPQSLSKPPSTPPPSDPGKAPPKYGSQQPLHPPPPKRRPPPVHTVMNERPDPPELPKGVAEVPKGAAHRARPLRPNEPDLSTFRRHGFDWVNHRVADITGAFDDNKVTIGLDWYKTCTPLLQGVKVVTGRCGRLNVSWHIAILTKAFLSLVTTSRRHQ